MIDAGFKANNDYAACADGLEQDVFIKYPDGTRFKGPVWPGDCYFPDYTSARVREWFGEQYAGMLDLGIAGIWNDMNEPAIISARGESPPDHVVHDMDGHGGDHSEAHNIYGMQMVRATYEGLRKLRPDRRPFIITRSAFAGVQRYTLGWTADNESTWESMALTIPMLLNLGLSGLAFVGPAEIVAHAPLDLLPLYVRAGAVIHMGEVMQYVGETPAKKMTLHIYPGNAISHLYEDAGEGWEHLRGAYRHMTFETEWGGETLTLRRSVAGSFELEYNGYEVVVHGLDTAPAQVVVDGVEVEVKYDGEPVIATVAMGKFANVALRTDTAHKRANQL